MWNVIRDWISRGHSRVPGRHESARQHYLKNNKQRLFPPEMCRCPSIPWLWICWPLLSQLNRGAYFFIWASSSCGLRENSGPLATNWALFRAKFIHVSVGEIIYNIRSLCLFTAVEPLTKTPEHSFTDQVSHLVNPDTNGAWASLGPYRRAARTMY